MHAASLFFFILSSAVAPHCGISPRKAALPGCFYMFMWSKLLESFSDFTKDACTHHLLHWTTPSVSATLLKWAHHAFPVTLLAVCGLSCSQVCQTLLFPSASSCTDPDTTQLLWLWAFISSHLYFQFLKKPCHLVVL